MAEGGSGEGPPQATQVPLSLCCLCAQSAPKKSSVDEPEPEPEATEGDGDKKGSAEGSSDEEGKLVIDEPAKEKNEKGALKRRAGDLLEVTDPRLGPREASCYSRDPAVWGGPARSLGVPCQEAGAQETLQRQRPGEGGCGYVKERASVEEGHRWVAGSPTPWPQPASSLPTLPRTPQNVPRRQKTPKGRRRK